MQEIGISPEKIAAVIREAGVATRIVYDRGDFNERLKDDDSPVTEADLAADRIIVAGLSALSDIPIVSEESVGTNEEALKVIRAHDLFWLVDPLDGTKDFINRTGDFSVNIALIHEGRPIAGYVYEPVRSVLYAASEDTGAFREGPDGKIQQIAVRPFNVKKFVCLVSRLHGGGEDHVLKKRFKGAEVRAVGSSLKFCRIAEGEADVYVRANPTRLWDTAAAQCVLEQAGGIVVDFQGQPLSYEGKDLINPSFIALGDPKLDPAKFI